MTNINEPFGPFLRLIYGTQITKGAMRVDARTFQAEVLKLEKLMYHVSYSMLRNNEDCADAVQEALARAWQKHGSLHDPEKFKAWLMRILVNQCKDMLRRQIKRNHIPLEEDSATVPPPEPPTPLDEAIDKLKPEWRLVVTLHYQDGYSIEDIARLLRLPSGTVKTRMKSARKQLGVLLHDDWKEGLV